MKLRLIKLFTSLWHILGHLESCAHGDTAPKSVWELYYVTQYTGYDYSFKRNEEINTKNNEAFVFSCIFYDLTSSSIKFTSNRIKFLHSLSFFSKCRNSNYGGAIYFNCNSQIVQHRFCTTNTYVTSNRGFHSYTNLLSQSNYNNTVVESSITNCIQQNNERTLEFFYGNIGIYYTNISKNTASYYSGAYIQDPNNIDSVNFSTFEGNNAASGHACIHHFKGDGVFKDFMCNFVGNTQSSTSGGLIFMHGSSLTIENCSIQSPYGNGKAISADYSPDHYIYIINCNFDQYSISAGTYSTTKVVLTKSLYSLNHLSTYECEAKYNIPLQYNRKSVYFEQLKTPILFVCFCIILI